LFRYLSILLGTSLDKFFQEDGIKEEEDGDEEDNDCDSDLDNLDDDGPTSFQEQQNRKSSSEFKLEVTKLSTKL
jgi:hypothetical protein